MDIAYIVPSLLKKGPVIVVYELARLMIERGHSVKVYYFDENTTNVLNFPCQTIKIKFFDHLDFSKYDVVHSHCLKSDAYVFFHKQKNHKTRYLSTIHCFAYQNFRSTHNPFCSIILTMIWMLVLRRHDTLIVLSQKALSYYEKFWLKNKHLTFVYNSRSIELLTLSKIEQQKVIDFKGKSKLLGINAILTPRKAVDVVINSLTILENVKLYIVGDGSARKNLENLVAKKGVQDKVCFVGYKENAHNYIPFYDVYMMPSNSEGFPLALIEAISLKCNAVVSDIPIFKEFFTDQEVTFFKVGDYKDCARAINEALKYDKSNNAYVKYEKDYSPQQFVNKYISIYEEI